MHLPNVHQPAAVNALLNWLYLNQRAGLHVKRAAYSHTAQDTCCC